MKVLFALVLLAFTTGAFSDGQIDNVASLRLEGKIAAYFNVEGEDEAAALQSRGGILTVIPGEGDKISGSGESKEGQWFVQLMHPTTTETHVKEVIEGVAVAGQFYASDDLKVSYKDVDGATHALESGAAKVKVTKADDNSLQLQYHGDLKFVVLPEEVDAEQDLDARKLTHKKQVVYSYSQPSYYAVPHKSGYQPSYQVASYRPVYQAVSKSHPVQAVSKSHPVQTVSKSYPVQTVSKSYPVQTVSKSYPVQTVSKSYTSCCPTSYVRLSNCDC